MDTADGIFMTTAYKWAFTAPLRKLYYNVTVTSVSVLAAFLIGTVELIQVLKQEAELAVWIHQLDQSSEFQFLRLVACRFIPCGMDHLRHDLERHEA